jgi:hypothetical protein
MLNPPDLDGVSAYAFGVLPQGLLNYISTILFPISGSKTPKAIAFGVFANAELELGDMDTPAPEHMNRTTSELFLDFSRKKLLEQYWPRMQRAVKTLTDEQIWWRPNEASNSVGNLLLHLNGNVWQWLVSSFNRLEDARNRPAEFSATGELSGTELLDRLGRTINEAGTILNRLKTEELTAIYHIQGYTVSGLSAVYQVVEHFGMHYGQVIYIAKMLQGKDLGFYSELKNTGRATGGSSA